MLLHENNDNVPVTMRDVARLAGVSTATVSRTLTSPAKVSPITRNKVELAIQHSGYKPQRMLLYPSHCQSRLLLVLTPDLTDPAIISLIKGMKSTAAKQGYRLLITEYQRLHSQTDALIALLDSHPISGIILTGSQTLPVEDEKLYQRLPTMVMVNEFITQPSIPAIYGDQLSAAFNATCYLHQTGHRRIAFIAAPDDALHSRHRRLGYSQALHRCLIAFEPGYVISSPVSYEGGANAVSELMALNQPPTAILCHSDTIAIGVLAQARKQGLSVPDDISVIGFDNIPQAEYTTPPLTTMDMSAYQMGETAVLSLVKQQSGISSDETILLESHLLVRQSTASPKGH